MYQNGNIDRTQIVNNASNPVNNITYPNFNRNRYIGVRNNGANVMNGSIDEFMYFNRTLLPAEIKQIYQGTYSKFYPIGEMLFQNNNLSGSDILNITMPNCQQLNGSLIKFKINNGSYVTLNSTCMYDNYNLSELGDVTSANVTLQLNSSNTNFYSPLINGNITLNIWNSTVVITVTGGDSYYFGYSDLGKQFAYNEIQTGFENSECFSYNSDRGGFAYNYLSVVKTNCTNEI
jgi:hypothetical protein